ncbi:hypothetical protein NKG05_26460 [Oerskovia sp. M15]
MTDTTTPRVGSISTTGPGGPAPSPAPRSTKPWPTAGPTRAGCTPSAPRGGAARRGP